MIVLTVEISDTNDEYDTDVQYIIEGIEQGGGFVSSVEVKPEEDDD